MLLLEILTYLLQRLRGDFHSPLHREAFGGSHLHQGKLVFPTLHLSVPAAYHLQLFAHLPLPTAASRLDTLLRQRALALSEVIITLLPARSTAPLHHHAKSVWHHLCSFHTLIILFKFRIRSTSGARGKEQGARDMFYHFILCLWGNSLLEVFSCPLLLTPCPAQLELAKVEYTYYFFISSFTFLISHYSFLICSSDEHIAFLRLSGRPSACSPVGRAVRRRRGRRQQVPHP